MGQIHHSGTQLQVVVMPITCQPGAVPDANDTVVNTARDRSPQGNISV